MNEAGKGRVGEWGKKRRRTKDAGRREEGMGEGENGRMGEWENGRILCCGWIGD